MKTFSPWFISGILSLLNRRRKQALQTTQAYLDSHFKDEKLKALLVSQWGDYGVPPSKSVFAIHALIVSHYIHGAYYPKGGSQSIAQTILPVIKTNGGDYLLNCEVQEILLEDGKAVGCKCLVQRGGKQREETFYAPIIISGAGAYPTFRRLLKTPLFPELEQIQAANDFSAITVYLGLKENPDKLGVSGGNFWIYSDYKHNEIPKKQQNAESEIQFCFVSFPSLKDRSKKNHTAEIITFIPYRFFESWAETPWKDRGEDYEAIKKNIATKLLAFVEKRFPGFGDLVEFIEVSTPLSMEKFTGRPGGLLYGMPHTPARYESACFKSLTPVPNLYLAGNDVFAPGLVGAMMGGLSAACSALGKWSFMKVMPSIFKTKS